MAMTFDGQRSSSKSEKECGTSCMGCVLRKRSSSSLLGKLAPPCLCYKHIPSNSFPVENLLLLPVI